jgi:hypothetical protein
LLLEGAHVKKTCKIPNARNVASAQVLTEGLRRRQLAPRGGRLPAFDSSSSVNEAARFMPSLLFPPAVRRRRAIYSQLILFWQNVFDFVTTSASAKTNTILALTFPLKGRRENPKEKMPKRAASADEADDGGRAVKRSRGSGASPTDTHDNPQDATTPTIDVVDELGFENEASVSKTLMASSERCEAAWHDFVATRRSDGTSESVGDLEGRPDDVRDFVRRK